MDTRHALGRQRMQTAKATWKADHTPPLRLPLQSTFADAVGAASCCRNKTDCPLSISAAVSFAMLDVIRMGRLYRMAGLKRPNAVLKQP